MEQLAVRQKLFREVRALFDEKDQRFGVYVHLPFCAKRCEYCAFVSWDNRSHDIAAYHRTLCQDLASANTPLATSVFFGGGTPSLLTGTQLVTLLAQVPRTADAEVTIECNPETIDQAKAEVFAAAGINRVSIGVQSMDENVLRLLGRQHNPRHIASAITALHAVGLKNVSIDLMFGTVGQSLETVRKTVETVLEFPIPPTHISGYALTVEEGTLLAADDARQPNDDEQAEHYVLFDDLLTSAGYGNYEISNWAKPGAVCRHNVHYWAQGDYAGFGVSAHAHQGGRRTWVTSDLDAYFRGTRTVGTDDVEGVSGRFEALELALRTCIGVPSSSFLVNDRELLDDFVDIIDDRVVLNVRGRLLANEIATRLSPLVAATALPR